MPALVVLREVVILGDGACWIWGLADEHFGRRTEIVERCTKVMATPR